MSTKCRGRERAKKVFRDPLKLDSVFQNRSTGNSRRGNWHGALCAAHSSPEVSEIMDSLALKIESC